MAAALITVGLGEWLPSIPAASLSAEAASMHSRMQVEALLVSVDQSSTCLTCHEAANLASPSSFHVSTPVGEMPAGTPPKQRSPGGDFGWLKKTYTFTVRGTQITEDGQTHGHNVVAGAYNYIADTDNTTAPGGTFQASQLGCQSCHDPHGQGRRLSDGTYATTGAPIIGSGSYNNSLTPAAGRLVGLYRLLASPVYSQGGSGAIFTSFPIAVAPSTYNRTEATQQTRVAYGHTGQNTWGNWCTRAIVQCTALQAMSTLWMRTRVNRRNQLHHYVKSGDLTGVFATGAGPFLRSCLSPRIQETLAR
jgi:hypothetical protein